MRKVKRWRLRDLSAIAWRCKAGDLIDGRLIGPEAEDLYTAISARKLMLARLTEYNHVVLPPEVARHAPALIAMAASARGVLEDWIADQGYSEAVREGL